MIYFFPFTISSTIIGLLVKLNYPFFSKSYIYTFLKYNNPSQLFNFTFMITFHSIQYLSNYTLEAPWIIDVYIALDLKTHFRICSMYFFYKLPSTKMQSIYYSTIWIFPLLIVKSTLKIIYYIIIYLNIILEYYFFVF